MTSASLPSGRRTAVYVGTVAAVLVAWAALSLSGAVQPLLLASPGDTWQALRAVLEAPGGIWGAVGTTLAETLTAFVIAAVLALPIGVLVGSIALLRKAYEPVFTSLSAVPLVVLYPVLAATLGVGTHSKIALGGLYAFFPMVIATVRAAGTVDRRLLTAAVAMGASRRQSLTRVVVPLIFPPLLASMRVALGLALVTVIAGEFISGSDGVGFELGNASQLLDTPTLFAWVVVACLLTVVVNLGFTVFSTLARKGIYR